MRLSTKAALGITCLLLLVPAAGAWWGHHQQGCPSGSQQPKKHRGFFHRLLCHRGGQAQGYGYGCTGYGAGVGAGCTGGYGAGCTGYGAGVGAGCAGGYGAGVGAGCTGGYGAGLGAGCTGGYGAGCTGGYGAGVGAGCAGGYGAGLGAGCTGGYGAGVGAGCAGGYMGGVPGVGGVIGGVYGGVPAGTSSGATPLPPPGWSDTDIRALRDAAAKARLLETDLIKDITDAQAAGMTAKDLKNVIDNGLENKKPAVEIQNDIRKAIADKNRGGGASSSPDRWMQQVNERLARIEERLNSLPAGTVGRSTETRFLPRIDTPPSPPTGVKPGGVSQERGERETTRDQIASSIREWDDYFKRRPSGEASAPDRSVPGREYRNLTWAEKK